MHVDKADMLLKLQNKRFCNYQFKRIQAKQIMITFATMFSPLFQAFSVYGGGGEKHVAGGGKAVYGAVKLSSSWKSFSFISASAPALVGNTGGRGFTAVTGV